MDEWGRMTIPRGRLGGGSPVRVHMTGDDNDLAVAIKRRLGAGLPDRAGRTGEILGARAIRLYAKRSRSVGWVRRMRHGPESSECPESVLRRA